VPRSATAPFEHDHGQTVFVARLRAERAPDGTAYERFGDAGPTALLPRGDRHWGLIHAVPGEEADAVAARRGRLAGARAGGFRLAHRSLECGPPLSAGAGAGRAPDRAAGCPAGQRARRPSIRSARRASISACAMR
jgi:hypothetical protein